MTNPAHAANRPLDRLIRRLRSAVLGAAAVGDQRMLAEVARLESRLGSLESRMLVAVGDIASRHVRGRRFDKITDAEFRIFSQWGEDGIIQYLISVVPTPKRLFVEFGVQDYRESNTRFLLEHDYWRGVIVDAGTAHMDYVVKTRLGWRHSIEAVSTFLTCDNLNDTIAAAGLSGDIGLLSIDVDGNDYWLLDSLTVVQPRILVVEYNSLFGPTSTVTIPYQPTFSRCDAHWSCLYYGASLGALHHLASTRGYSLVGCGSAGCNAFFVTTDALNGLRPLTPGEAFVQRQHRESRNPAGDLTYITSIDRQLELIADLPLIDVFSGDIAPVRDMIDTQHRHQAP